MSEEALHIAEKRREAKGKGERERYTQLNAEFQRIARRDKNAFFNEQYKEIEENNRMGKTKDLFDKTGDIKTGDIKGIFDARMGMVKDRNSKDLTEAKELRRSGKIHRTIERRIRWWCRRTRPKLVLRELQNSNSLLNSHRQENVGSHQKMIPHVQG